ncbi:tyrosine-protein phosphatase [Phyllobacterium sp. TAF24]|uniref:tyrosine-protein phosphatase n=1 Tax=Phyllobacterium sp. TAF24 TaxID=3233068 RepID=UPI003F9768A3
MTVTQTHKSSRRRPIAVRTGGALLALVLMIGGYYGIMRWQGNFHTTLPGELYRSAQPSPSQIAFYKKTYGIRTIINLRGENTGRDWYDKEVAAAKKSGVGHIDFRMSSRQILSQKDAETLLALMKQAEKPILIHCEGGADRTGLAAALYVAAIAHGDEEHAESQFSPRFGHFSIWANPAYAMDMTFEDLEPWLGFPGS